MLGIARQLRLKSPENVHESFGSIRGKKQFDVVS